MKNFFKLVLANMLGCLFSSLIFILIIVFIIVGTISNVSKEKEIKVESKSILAIDLDHTILERGTKNPFQQLDYSQMKNIKSLGLNEITNAIEFAATDDKISAIYLEPGFLNISWASLEEIRNSLIKFKESGKPIITYSEIFTQKAYYLTQISDYIFINPEGYFDLRGLSSQLVFFKGALSKLDIQAQIIRHGKFKSAVEPFTNDKMSPENKEQYQDMLNSLWSLFVSSTSKYRNIPEDSISYWANNISIRTADDAYKYGLIDSIMYKDEVLELLKTKISSDKPIDKLPAVKLTQYAKSPNVKSQKYNTDQIAVIYAVGEIRGGQGSETIIGSEKIASNLRSARLDKNIKAVVLRVNSPGGSALASEVIWREVELLKKEKPIVVSMSDLAASGGYYIACGANMIFAQPNTLTGSIGVFGMMFNFGDFFKNKLGVTTDIVQTNKYADMPNLTRQLTPFELNILQMQVEKIYDTFITRVANGRNMSIEEVEKIAQGRVWSGIDAKKIGLVDELGGLKDAIKAAAELAELKEYYVIELPEQKEFVDQLISDLMGNQINTIIRNKYLKQYEFLFHIENADNKDPFMTRLPFDISID